MRRRPSRRRGQRPAWQFLTALFAAVVLLAGVPYALAARDARRPPDEAVPIVLPLPGSLAIEALQRARVEKVVDGDTIEATIDGRRVTVRYFGVDTPERGERCYREAADRNQRLIGQDVLLLQDARDRDGFGRLLRYVFLASGQSIDATLVAEGFGLAWRRDGQYRERIVSLEEEAQAARRGCLWR